MKEHLKILENWKLGKVKIDNNVFRLHYKFTSAMLFVFCLMLSSKQFFGDPIECDVDEKNKNIVNVFCWITGTYIVNKNIGDELLPGLGNNPSTDLSRYSKLLYYQWIFVIFCLQALFFYIPRTLWRNWEGGLISQLVENLRTPIVDSEKWNGLAKQKLIDYILSSKYAHNIYAIRYGICEILNVVNLILQFCLMDWYLQGKFMSYGVRVTTQMKKSMNYVFPKLTKCMYSRYGPSGNIETRDALCILPLNILNEKFFVIIWYWFFILLFVSVGALVYRAMFLFWGEFRMHLLRAQTTDLDITRQKVRFIVQHISFGDFFILYRLGQNLNPIIFKEVILGIHDVLATRRPIKVSLMAQI